MTSLFTLEIDGRFVHEGVFVAEAPRSKTRDQTANLFSNITSLYIYIPQQLPFEFQCPRMVLSPSSAIASMRDGDSALQSYLPSSQHLQMALENGRCIKWRTLKVTVTSLRQHGLR